jgi:adenylosuccinate lyase
MIARYEVPTIAAIWSESKRFEKMLQVEMALLKSQEELGLVPAGTHKAFSKVKINPDRIREIELTTKHDVIAFCTSITEQVPPEAGRYFHFGVTSSDILDSALSLQVRDSMKWVISNLESLIQALSEQATATQDLLSMGRSHGMNAEPMIFGQKFLSFMAEFQRRLVDYREAAQTEITGQISGAVGNYTVVSPELESQTLKKLELPVEPVSTQVIPRDHLLKIVSLGAMIATAIERLAIEIRHLHHSDIGELHEGFSVGQKGSSTMPHKKNPISGENLSGLARVIRSHVEIAHQNCLLWHERDISHSSAERLYLPDHFGLLVYSLVRMAATVQALQINREKISSKVESQFQSLSSLVLHELIQQNSAPREVLYSIVQSSAFESKSLKEFTNSIASKCQAQGFTANLSALNFDQILKRYQAHYESIRKRVQNS